MQIQVPQNAYAMSAGQTMAQSLRSPAGQAIRTTTFECADLAYGFEVEQLSEKISSTNTFSPATRQLFGLDEIDLNNCMTILPSPTAPTQRPPTPDLVADFSDAASSIGPESPPTPEPQANIAGFASTGGKTTWPGMNAAEDGDNESENEDEEEEDDDGDGFGGSQYGDESVQQAVGYSSGKSVRKSVPVFAGKSVSKSVYNHNEESVDDDEDGEEEDEDCEHESEDEEEDHGSDSGSEYEDGNSDNESESESVKALPRGGKTLNNYPGYSLHNKPQDEAEGEQVDEDEEAEQPG